MFQHDPRAIVLQKSHFAKIGKNGRYGFSNCVTTVHARNNSSSGLSNEGGLSLLVPHRRYLAVFGGIWRYLAVFGICVFYASCQPSGCIRSSVYISITAINDHK